MLRHRTLRSLANLQVSGSSSRVLNLVALSRRYEGDVEFIGAPMFRSPLLGRSIILKHRLRREERGDFDGYRNVATKVIFPIDPGDLKLGGRSLFVSQKGYAQAMQSIVGDEFRPGAQDFRLLELMDGLPSLDPFILREHLARNGFHPARQYFEISEADVDRMMRFAEEQVRALVTMAAGRAGSTVNNQAAKLARKLLSSLYDPEMDGLRGTLRMNESQFAESLFCWKGFLYYKWTLRKALPKVNEVVREIGEVLPRGHSDPEVKAYIAKARPRVRESIYRTLQEVNLSLAAYDDAYRALTSDGDPVRFRDFLLNAPAMFQELGERLGAVGHIVSFWSYRFPSDRRTVVTPDEFAELLQDFEDGLAGA